MADRGGDTFTIETRGGFRRVEFDADVFRFRDVRIVVDGTPVAVMPFPKSKSPMQQADFELDGHPLVAVAYLTEGPSTTDLQAIRFDVFTGGRSLRDGAPLSEVLSLAAAPGKVYPLSFQVIDVGLQVAPAASAPGLVIGVTRNASELGWPTAAALIAVMLLAVGVATAIARGVWNRIRAKDQDSVARRAALGCLATTGIYVAMFLGALGLILLVGPFDSGR